MGFHGNSILMKSLFDIGYCIYSVQGIFFESKDTGWGFYIKLNYDKNCSKTRQVAYRSSRVSEWLWWDIEFSKANSHPSLKQCLWYQTLYAHFFISQTTERNSKDRSVRRTDQKIKNEWII